MTETGNDPDFDGCRGGCLVIMASLGCLVIFTIAMLTTIIIVFKALWRVL